MYSGIQLASKYLRYYLTAHNGKGHGMHSPFVFQFILNVLNNRQGYDLPADIEALRKTLKARKEKLVVEDLGAGSRLHKTAERSIGDLARTSLKPPKYSQLLYRLAKYYKPQSVVELGTSLGTTTAYLARAVPSASIVTIEGSRSVQEVARENFRQLQLHQVQSLYGNFDDLLPGVLEELRSVDLGYIDGNHRYAPTVDYFNQLVARSHNNSIIVLDDIHWSAEMEQAWAEIKQHPAVRCTVDIFFLGFVFFREEFRVKQHFAIRY